MTSYHLPLRRHRVSEIFTAVKMGRRAIGIELKESYYRQSCANVRAAEELKEQSVLFEGIA